MSNEQTTPIHSEEVTLVTRKGKHYLVLGDKETPITDEFYEELYKHTIEARGEASKELVTELYKFWLFDKLELESTLYSEKDKRTMFFTDCILGLITFDESLDLKIGNRVIETMLHIHNNTVDSFIENETNYENFVTSCNYLITAITWDTNLFSPYFDTDEGFLIVDSLFEHLSIDDSRIYFSPTFIPWFLDFLQAKNA